jgi:hypothetical protein
MNEHYKAHISGVRQWPRSHEQDMQISQHKTASTS